MTGNNCEKLAMGAKNVCCGVGERVRGKECRRSKGAHHLG
jgi:hypothetical protein